jgi:glycosyltransferase involved in cell wall biosynthesis
MKKISVVISAFNEEGKIEKCLKSVKFADEIVFVDNSSTDKTKEIAQKYTKKIITQENNPDQIDQQKNTGFKNAENEWILSLDADEQVTPELEKEIIKIINSDTLKTGFFIPRKNYIFGKWIEHTGWYPDHQLRLFRKGKGSFKENYVHQILKIDGELGYLENPISHDNYESVKQFLTRAVSSYAPNEAEKLIADGYEVKSSDAIRFPLREFLNRFFKGEGYKDGIHGLMLSLLMSFYHFIVFAYVWEKQGFKESSEDVLKVADREFANAGKEIRYWVNTTEIENDKNPLHKNLLKVKRKFSK